MALCTGEEFLTLLHHVSCVHDQGYAMGSREICVSYPSKDKKWYETETYKNLGFGVGGEYLGANLAETTTVRCSLHIM